MSEPRQPRPSEAHDHPDEIDEDLHPHGPAPAKFPTGEPTEGEDRDDFVEETSRDSFPGSDPPAY